MRACVGVKKPQDLWMYNEKSEEELQRLLSQYSGPKQKEDETSEDEDWVVPVGIVTKMGYLLDIRESKIIDFWK